MCVIRHCKCVTQTDASCCWLLCAKVEQKPFCLIVCTCVYPFRTHTHTCWHSFLIVHGLKLVFKCLSALSPLSTLPLSVHSPSLSLRCSRLVLFALLLWHCLHSSAAALTCLSPSSPPFAGAFVPVSSFLPSFFLFAFSANKHTPIICIANFPTHTHTHTHTWRISRWENLGEINPFCRTDHLKLN